MIYFIGAGPRSELISVKGARLIGEADVIIYGSLVNPAILRYAKAEGKSL